MRTIRFDEPGFEEAVASLRRQWEPFSRSGTKRREIIDAVRTKVTLPCSSLIIASVALSCPRRSCA
jgi:hypothetical protein